jgi:hypothetical protein
MEPLDRGWVFAMDPGTHATGFVPSACLEQVGSGLAVLLKDHAGELAGHCVAIINCSAKQNWDVETPFRKRLAVEQSQLGVIFSAVHAPIAHFA